MGRAGVPSKRTLSARLTQEAQLRAGRRECDVRCTFVVMQLPVETGQLRVTALLRIRATAERTSGARAVFVDKRGPKTLL